MRKIIIGLVGPKKGGKGEFVKYLKTGRAWQVHVFVFSEILGKILTILCLEWSRENLQDVAIVLRGKFGNGILVKPAEREIARHFSAYPWTVVDGVRMWEEAEMVKRLGGVLVYITAPVEKRYEWAKLTSEKVDEKYMSYEEFLRLEEKETEKQIVGIGETADFKINNDKDLEHLYRKFEEVIQEISKEEK